MSLLESGLLVVHVIVALVICGIVLLQHGKGADMGAAFGSGSSGSVFGSSGSANFLSRSTAVLAAVFFLTSIVLTWYATTNREGGVVERSVIDKVMPKAPTSDVPSLPAPAAGTQQPALPPGAAPASGAPASPAVPAGSKAGEIPK